jgi:DNA processing protein
MNPQSITYQIALTQLKNVGDTLGKRLVAYTGSAEAIFEEKASTLQKIPGIGSVIANNLNREEALKQAEKEIEFINKFDIKPYYFLDVDYPKRLSECEDAPIVFYQKGNCDLNQNKIISIVGTRNATPYGKDRVSELLSDLKENQHNALIVSGMAFGIDASAHKGALKNNLETAAVLGHGLSHMYPAQHRKLASDILEQGCLLSDFLHSQKPERNNFVKRNRLIAALADATIVVESAITGGALLTAQMANSYNRDVFAFPGYVGAKYSEGCNKLIKANKAALIEGFKDLEYILGWEESTHSQKQLRFQLPELSPQEEQIVRLLKENQKLPIDIIIRDLNISVSEATVMLLNLEMASIVKSMPGKVYEIAI